MEQNTGHELMVVGGYTGGQDTVLLLVCWKLYIQKVKEKEMC